VLTLTIEVEVSLVHGLVPKLDRPKISGSLCMQSWINPPMNSHN